MLILHGAGSRKENHADFARACAARGWVALAYDQRGHGESGDEMGPGALADVGRMAAFLAAAEGVDGERICVRGSSMGGFMAVHARAAEPRKLILVAGGHHRSVQHDAELQEVALRWMERELGR